MEEARQYTPVRWEIIAAGLLSIGGLVVLLAGLVLQFLIGGQSVLLGLGIYLLSRAMIRALVLVRPDAFPGQRSNRRVWTVGGLAILLAASAFLFLLFLGLLG